MPITLAVIEFLAIWNIYTYYPDGWDQSEYSFNIRNNYLPHGPYLAHFLLGKFLSLVWQPSESLSIISLLAGSLNIFLFYKINEAIIKKTYEGELNILFPAVASVLLGGSSLYLLNGGSQEVYILQFFFVLASIYFVYVASNLVVAGLLFGLAYATHNATIFLLPSLLYLIWIASAGRGNRIRDGLVFLAGGIVSAVLIYSYFIATIAINGDDVAPWSGTKFGDFLGYLGGIAPALSFEKLIDLKLNLFNLIKIQYQFDYHILGYSDFIKYPFYAGLLILAFKNLKILFFFLLYAFFYFYYESIAGNLDTGLYVVYLLGVIAVSIAFFVDFARRKCNYCFVIFLVFIPVVMVPGYVIYKERVKAVNEYLYLRHFGATQLSVIWANQYLPERSILVTGPPVTPQFPYYITRIRHLNWKYMQSRRSGGLYTPVTASYHISNQKLVSFLRNGYKLYSLVDRETLLHDENPNKDKDIDWNNFDFTLSVIQPDLDQTLTLLDVPAAHKTGIANEIKVLNSKLYEVTLRNLAH